MPFDINFNNPYAQSRMFNIFGNQAPQRIMPQSPPQLAPQMRGQQTSNKRLFSSTIPTPNPVQTGIDEGNPGDEQNAGMRYFDILQQLGANRPQQTAYEDALRNPPQRGDYNPSKLRRLAAALIGGATGMSQGPTAAIGAAEHVGNAPYERALQDYQQRTDAARAAAEMEHANISDYRENLKAGATLSIADRNARNEDFKNRSLRDYQRSQAQNAGYGEETDRIRALGQLQRWSEETDNEQEKNWLDSIRVGIERGDKESEAEYRRALASIGRSNAVSAGRQAGAAETTAGARKMTAEKIDPLQMRLPSEDEITKATALAMEQMSYEPEYAKIFSPNPEETGPAYIVNKEWDTPIARRALKERIDMFLQKGYPRTKPTPSSGEDLNPFGNLQYNRGR